MVQTADPGDAAQARTAGSAPARSRRWPGILRALEAGAMLAALGYVGLVIAQRYEAAQDEPCTTPGLTLGGAPIGGLRGSELRAAADAAAEGALDRPLALRAGSERVLTTARRLGAVPVVDD